MQNRIASAFKLRLSSRLRNYKGDKKGKGPCQCVIEKSELTI